MKYEISENNQAKILKSPIYNFIFDKNNGLFMRWGETQNDDPDFSFFGPEILDMEISTICHGGGTPCAWCYKSNTVNGINMSFETFKTIFHKLPRTVTQIAFGIGDIDANPDLINILNYCRNNDYQFVVPNITVNGYRMTDEWYDKLANVLGAVAVSYYDKDVCYNAIENFSKRGMKQVNIHALLADETLDKCRQLIDDAKNDTRLSGLNAIVFLFLKPKGKRNKLHPVQNFGKFQELINYALESGINFGFDSCASPMFLKSVNPETNSTIDYNRYKQIEQMVEPCESTLFSYYINVKGVGYPCSFIEGEDGFDGIDVIGAKDFLSDVWAHRITGAFRKQLLDTVRSCPVENCRMCPHFNIYNFGE